MSLTFWCAIDSWVYLFPLARNIVAGVFGRAAHSTDSGILYVLVRVRAMEERGSLARSSAMGGSNRSARYLFTEDLNGGRLAGRRRVSLPLWLAARLCVSLRIRRAVRIWVSGGSWRADHLREDLRAPAHSAALGVITRIGTLRGAEIFSIRFG